MHCLTYQLDITIAQLEVVPLLFATQAALPIYRSCILMAIGYYKELHQGLQEVIGIGRTSGSA